jgi:hypothetical protein
MGAQDQVWVKSTKQINVIMDDLLGIRSIKWCTTCTYNSKISNSNSNSMKVVVNTTDCSQQLPAAGASMEDMKDDRIFNASSGDFAWVRILLTTRSSRSA